MATKANPDLTKGLEDLKQHHAASLSAIHESGKTLHKGMVEIQQFVSDHIADSFNTTMEVMKSMCGAKTPQDAANIHKEWLQGAMKNHMDKTTQISQKTASLFKEASQPMQDLSKQATQKAFKQ